MITKITHCAFHLVKQWSSNEVSFNCPKPPKVRGLRNVSGFSNNVFGTV